MKAKRIRKVALAALVVEAAFLTQNCDVFGAVRLVPGVYPTIQAGIDAAGPGDTVVVAEGLYTGAGNRDIDFNGKTITVRSENGPESCIIDCQYTPLVRGFYFHNGEDANSILSGFTIRRGRAGRGGGIYCVGSSPLIKNCTITGTIFGSQGGGIHCASASNPAIVDCTISNNTVEGSGGDWGLPGISVYGGGVYCTEDSYPTIQGCIITNNRALGGSSIDDQGGDGRGGGIYGDAIIHNCLISDNTAAGGNAGGNGGDGIGGGIYCHSSSSISNCTIVNNTAVEGSDPGYGGLSAGGGVSGAPPITNSIAWGNTAIFWPQLAPGPLVTYSDVQGGRSGTGNIDADPQFIAGPLGDYYLKHIWAGQLIDSPCVDAGSDLAVNLGMDTRTTRTDGEPDTGMVDIGYHYPLITAVPDQDYYVDGVDGNDLNDGLTPETAFATIQRSVDEANDGNTVLVYPAVYSEAVNFDGKAITVQGQADYNVPVIEAPGDYGVSFYTDEGPNSVLKNFVIRNSVVGVFLVDAFPTLRNLTIVDNNTGVAAYAGAEPDITDCIFYINNENLFGCTAQYSWLLEEPNEPLFVDAGAGDYHLKSEGWRWTGSGSTWVWDDVTSPCIDAGNPGTPLGDEPESVPQDPDNLYGVNVRVNMGAYGGTRRASIGPHGWALLADLNNDGIVDWLDASLWAQYWLDSGSELAADLDRNGNINGFDYALFGLGWSSETIWR